MPAFLPHGDLCQPLPWRGSGGAADAKGREREGRGAGLRRAVGIPAEQHPAPVGCGRVRGSGRRLAGGAAR